MKLFTDQDAMRIRQRWLLGARKYTVILPQDSMSFHVSFHVHSFQLISHITYHIISDQTISHHVMSPHSIMSAHIIFSYHILSYHIIKYHI